MIALRPYQEAAIAAFWNHIRTREDNPCIVLPTGAGKTPCLAVLCQDAVAWGGRVLILSHVKELLEQGASTLAAVGLEAKVGVYSAGLGRRDTTSQILIAGIQSVFNKADQLGSFDIILIDEAHLIPNDGEGRYRTFIADAKIMNPQVRIGGLTATPYRTGEGMICTKDGILNEVCYEIGVRELIEQGWLCNLRSKIGETKVDTSKLHVRAGEFIESEMEALYLAEEVLKPTVDEIMSKTLARHSCLIFCAGIKHATAVRNYIRQTHQCEMVIGDTPSAERAATLAAFKERRIKYLVNVSVLTTGFDATGIDAIALLRATLSPGLYYQMVGRGFRLHPGKENCLVMDFGANIARHGPIDQIKIREPGGKGPPPMKECPQCHEAVPIATMVCPDCGHVWEAGEREGPKVAPRSSNRNILSTEAAVPVWQKVQSVKYLAWKKKGADDNHPRTMCVQYEVGWQQHVREWVCVEHGIGRARSKAEQWWSKRSHMECPSTVDEAIHLAEGGCLAKTLEILVDESGQFAEIKQYKLGDVPEIGDAAEAKTSPSWQSAPLESMEDIPF